MVNFRVSAMWCWEKCIFCGFGVEHSVYDCEVHSVYLCIQFWMSLLIFCCVDLSNVDSGVLKSPTIIVWESKSHFRLLRTCFMYLGAPVLGAYIFRIVSSSYWIDPFTIM